MMFLGRNGKEGSKLHCKDIITFFLGFDVNEEITRLKAEMMGALNEKKQRGITLALGEPIFIVH